MTVLSRRCAVLLLLLISACTAAQPYEWKNVVIKGNGFIDGVVYNPAAPNTVYINTDMGGAYRWDEPTHQWQCMTDWARCDDDSAKHFGVETLAVDPTDAGRVYMAVGTYMSPTAIMRSSDGGRTFERTNVRIKSNGNGSARNTGQRMMVDPNQPSILYYGTRVDGLWKSTDRGQTWTSVESFPTIGHNEGWGKDTGLLFVQFDRASGKRGNPTPVVYVGVFEPTEGATRVYRSTDAGATWVAVSGAQYTAGNTFPQRMALTPDGKTAYVTYGTSTSYPGPYGLSKGRVFKIANPAGNSPKWDDVTPDAKCSFSAIAIDPTQPSVVYAGEINNYSPADRIWRSSDAGQSWTAMNPNSHRDDSSAPYVRTFRVHWMGDLQIDPQDANVAMFTTGYGLYRTTNLSAEEPTWAFFNDGFEQSACNELASPATGPVHLISAIGDRDGYRHDDFTRSPALGTLGRDQNLSRGGCPDIDVAVNDPRVVIRTVHVTPYVQYSLDNAVSWQWMPEPPAGVSRAGEVAVSADGKNVVWLVQGTGLFTSVRQGDGWTAWTDATVPNTNMDGGRVLSDPNDPALFYAYSGKSTFRSVDRGTTWNAVTDDAPAKLRWIRAVPGFKGHLWAGGHGDVGLWRSTNGGEAWTRVAKDSIAMAYVVGVGAPVSEMNYPCLFIGGTVAGQAGVFRSDDEGQTWTKITDARHEYGYLSVIQGDPRVYGRAYLGSNGRGIVVGDIRPAAAKTK